MFIELSDDVIINTSNIDHIFSLHKCMESEGMEFVVIFSGKVPLEINMDDYNQIFNVIKNSTDIFHILEDGQIINILHISYIWCIKNNLSTYQVRFKGTHSVDILQTDLINIQKKMWEANTIYEV